MSSGTISYERVGRAALVTMDDGKANVMSIGMQRALHEALDHALAEEVVVVIRGRPGIFSAGFDLRVMDGTGPAKYEMVMGGLRLAERIFSFPLPVVMACTGHAIAMGLFLLLSGDYRIGASGPSRLVANEVSLGMSVPRGAIEVMRHRMTPGALDRAATLADPIPTELAVPWGVLDLLVPPSEVYEVAMTRARILADLDFTAHRTTKERLRGRAMTAVREAIDQDGADLAARLQLVQEPDDPPSPRP